MFSLSPALVMYLIGTVTNIIWFLKVVATASFVLSSMGVFIFFNASNDALKGVGFRLFRRFAITVGVAVGVMVFVPTQRTALMMYASENMRINITSPPEQQQLSAEVYRRLQRELEDSK